MKKLIIALFLINICSFIHAEPTNPSIQKVTQPNGLNSGVYVLRLVIDNQIVVAEQMIVK
jgi:hypothetical protein